MKEEKDISVNELVRLLGTKDKGSAYITKIIINKRQYDMAEIKNHGSVYIPIMIGGELSILYDIEKEDD